MPAILRTPEDRFDGPPGLTLPMELESRVTGLLVMDTTLGTEPLEALA